MTNRRTVRPAVNARLRQVLYVVLTLFSVLLANGLYLSGVSWTEYFTGNTYQTHFYQWMFLVHLALGLLLIAPVIVFGVAHMLRTKDRRNRRAVKIGYALLAASIAILVSGVLLMRVGNLSLPFLPSGGNSRRLVYWLHLLTPLAVIWLYVIHRLVGSKIKWHVARKVALATFVFVALMVGMQASDPVRSPGSRPIAGDKYFQPSLAQTSTGAFIAEETLNNDEYCLRCHEEIYNSAIHSAHKLSSFNNPAYRASVRETRQQASTRDGTVQASRWCAGCHDPVVLFSGKFDDPNYDDVADPTAHAGITCSVCHSIQSIDSHVGNSDYTIDEPKHYPFAYSDHPLLQSLNSLMIKAKPAFHKTEMLKPLHKTSEFCATCHKVSLPSEVTNYKDWMRGQNHYDSYLLSGVSGHGARSFYYPPVAQENCNGCHMPGMASDGFGSRHFDSLGGNGLHSHAMPSANTALAYWMGDQAAIDSHQAYLRDSLRIDLFGIRRDGGDGPAVAGNLTAPLTDHAEVVAGETVLIETVLRTMRLGHHFSQGTTDSNQIWVHWQAEQDGRIIAASGQMDDRNAVDPDSHFVNTFMLDRDGNRINRRNAPDIFTPLYSHQIPPGAGQTIHYRLDVPEQSRSPITVTATLRYRKFDTEYLDYIRADRDPAVDPLDIGRVGAPNDLPITDICSDTLTLNIVDHLPENLTVATSDEQGFPMWQRFNDYGIGLLLSGRSQLRQAAEAFAVVESMGRYDGPLNLARVQFTEGDLNAATESLARAAAADPPPPSWTHSWLSGIVNRQQGNLDAAAESLRSVLNTKIPQRGFDFSLDYQVRNQLGLTLIDLAQRAEVMGDLPESRSLLQQAQQEFDRVLRSDVENATAHANLAQIHSWLGNGELEIKHRRLHAKYKADDNAKEIAVPKARRKYPAAGRAAESVVVYNTSLQSKIKGSQTTTQSVTIQSTNTQPTATQPTATQPTNTQPTATQSAATR